MRPLFFFAALAVAACSHSPTGTAAQIPISVTGTSHEVAIDSENGSVSIVPGPGSLAINGTFLEPNGCPIQVAFEGWRIPQEIEIGIYAKYGADVTCLVLPQVWSYQALADSLPAGRYLVKVANFDAYGGQWVTTATDTVVVQ